MSLKQSVLACTIAIASATSAFATPATKTLHLVCDMTNREAKPFLSFLIDVQGDEASVKYLEFTDYDSTMLEIVRVPRDLEGCAPAQSVAWTKRELYIECAGDGDAGYFTLRPSKKGGYRGSVVFPNSAPAGYSDGQEIGLTCR